MNPMKHQLPNYATAGIQTESVAVPEKCTYEQIFCFLLSSGCQSTLRRGTLQFYGIYTRRGISYTIPFRTHTAIYFFIALETALYSVR